MTDCTENDHVINIPRRKKTHKYLAVQNIVLLGI